MEQSTGAVLKEDGKRKPSWLFIAGLTSVILAAAGMLHFTFFLTMAEFPTGALTSAKNWFFISLHILLGFSGLMLLYRARK